jgi:nucleoid-associated protein YgaU
MIHDALGPSRFLRRARRRNHPARLALIVATAATGLVVVGSVAYAESGTRSEQRVTVQAGDTLWHIAGVHYPGMNVEQAVATIESANHLDGASIRPGEILYLPAP